MQPVTKGLPVMKFASLQAHGEWFKSEMRAKKIGDIEVGKACGCTEGAVSMWRCGVNAPSSAYVPDISRTFGIDAQKYEAAIAHLRRGTNYKVKRVITGYAKHRKKFDTYVPDGEQVQTPPRAVGQLHLSNVAVAAPAPTSAPTPAPAPAPTPAPTPAPAPAKRSGSDSEKLRHAGKLIMEAVGVLRTCNGPVADDVLAALDMARDELLRAALDGGL